MYSKQNLFTLNNTKLYQSNYFYKLMSKLTKIRFVVV